MKIACSTRDLTVSYSGDPVLHRVNFTVPEGVVMGIVGPNGAGKSTLIKAMLGIVPAITGTTAFFGEPLSKVRLKVGYMPQSTAVDWDFPTTVLDVVLMGTYGRLGWLRRPGAKQRAEALDALAQVGMTEFSSRQIGELSGGQRQRVFLARALVQHPDLYFMDEPFQGIDALSQQAIVDVLHDLRAAGKTVVIVHHDLATVAHYCDYVTLLKGEVVAMGPVQSTFTRANIRATYDIPEGSEIGLAGAVD